MAETDYNSGRQTRGDGAGPDTILGFFANKQKQA